MLRRLLMVIASLAGPIWAEPVWADTAPVLPEATLKRIESAPDRFLEAAAVLIHGYGSGGGIDKAGIDRFVTLERAGARASAQRRLLAADLDANGAIGTDEIGVAAAAASARSRGKLFALHARADADGDGSVSAVELTAHAGAEALAAFTEAEAQAARSVLACDQDGDGHVTLFEVRRALAALEQAA